jgi:hypothetical protein
MPFHYDRLSQVKEKSHIIRALNASFHVDLRELGKKGRSSDIDRLHRVIILNCSFLRTAVCHSLCVRVPCLCVFLVVI